MLQCIVFNNITGQLMIPEGILEESFVKELGVYFQATGIVGGVIFSLVLFRYPKQLMLSAYIIGVGQIVTLGFFWYADTLASRPLLITAICLMGFFLFPVLFVAFELAVE